MKKFRVHVYSSAIEEREVSKETDASVWWVERIGDRSYPRTERKEASSHRWFDTWAEAKAWLLEEAEKNVFCIRRNLEAANSRLGNIKGLKDPTEAA